MIEPKENFKPSPNDEKPEKPNLSPEEREKTLEELLELVRKNKEIEEEIKKKREEK